MQHDSWQENLFIFGTKLFQRIKHISKYGMFSYALGFLLLLLLVRAPYKVHTNKRTTTHSPCLLPIYHTTSTGGLSRVC